MASNQNVTNNKEGLNKLKYEVANSLNISLNNGYNGNLTTKEAGHIGGQMVKRMIEQAESSLK